jgi:hypothetical protein
VTTCSQAYKNPIKLKKPPLGGLLNYFAAFLAAFFGAAFAVTAAAVFFLRGRNLPNDPI